MHRQCWLSYRILYVLHVIVYSVSCEIEKCPHRSHWGYREKAYCSKNGTAHYMCLEDLTDGNFIERCDIRPDFQRPGYKVVWSGNLDGNICKPTRYQPVSFFTSEGSSCILKKSSCEGEGQVVVNIGSTISDTLCRCDHSNGYAFVIQPSHACYCNPSEEDCSCYKKTCPQDEDLSAGYVCKRPNQIRNNCAGSHYVSRDGDRVKQSIKRIERLEPNNDIYNSMFIQSRDITDKIILILIFVIIHVACLLHVYIKDDDHLIEMNKEDPHRQATVDTLKVPSASPVDSNLSDEGYHSQGLSIESSVEISGSFRTKTSSESANGNENETKDNESIQIEGPVLNNTEMGSARDTESAELVSAEQEDESSVTSLKSCLV